MAESRSGPIGWFSPDPRGIIPLDSFVISRSLRRVVQRQQYDVRSDTAFTDVMYACADRPETWISDEIIRVYTQLHRRGLAHSVEVWFNQELVGGLYGVSVGGAFFGESMFSRRKDASKVALVYLVRHMIQKGFTLLDTQYMTPHLRQFGAVEIPRSDYLALLESAVCKNTFW
jgi:leucyl/phenylalanyl-tRNA--protein transferase